MAVRDDFSAGEVLAAADLNDTFASKLPYSYGTATPSTSDNGFLWYDSNSTPAEVKFWDGAAFQAIGGGKILQIVRATDTTNRSTTSTSFTDVSGMSVTITPQKSDSAIIILAAFEARGEDTSGSGVAAQYQITDSSNNAISGAEGNFLTVSDPSITAAFSMFAYATPATTSASTYKLRFRVESSARTAFVRNSQSTGQMYAIEVSA